MVLCPSAVFLVVSTLFGFFQMKEMFIDPVLITLSMWSRISSSVIEVYRCILFAARKAANELVEEFMLLANMSVATLISDAFPDRSLLR